MTNCLHARQFADRREPGRSIRDRFSHRLTIVGAVTEIATTTIPENGLPIYKLALPGTRALTVLVAFDAGARNERPEENGMAHFLEHLVFKGGEKYATYKDVNETAERLGGVLNAYTSHDLVAFHLTVRAESAPEAIDLLTRLRRAPADRRRGARPRARRGDPGDQPRLRPALDGRRVPDRPGGVRRSPAGTHRARPGGEPARFHARGDRRVPRAPLGGRTRGGLPRGQPRPPARRIGATGVLRALPRAARPRALRAGAGVRAREARRGARHQPVAPAHDLPPGHGRLRRAEARGADDLLDAARRLDGLAPIRGDPREAGLCYSVYAIDHAFADVPILQLGSGLESGKCVEAYTRMREIVDELRDDGPTEEEVHRARAYAAGRRVLAFENTNAVARYAANQSIVFGEDIDPDASIAALGRGHLRRGPRGRRGRGGQPRGRLRRTAHRGRVLKAWTKQARTRERGVR